MSAANIGCISNTHPLGWQAQPRQSYALFAVLKMFAHVNQYPDKVNYAGEY